MSGAIFPALILEFGLKLSNSRLPPYYRARMNDEDRQRWERMEANVAHLEHQVEQMNAVLIQQGRVVDLLKKQVQRQSEVLETIELDRIKANQTKPPHYQ